MLILSLTHFIQINSLKNLYLEISLLHFLGRKHLSQNPLQINSSNWLRDSMLAPIHRHLQEDHYLLARMILGNRVELHPFLVVQHLPSSVKPVCLVISQLIKSKKIKLRNKKTKLSHKFRVINLNYFRIRTIILLGDQLMLWRHQPRVLSHL